MKTYSQKPSEVKRLWYVLDANTVPMGRISTVAANLLIGKGKPTVTSHIDGGDFVIIVNASTMKLTGAKKDNKLYHRHSGFPGGLTTRKFKDVSNEEALRMAIRGMLPVNKLRDGRLNRLKIYEGPDHAHSAQKPTTYALNIKTGSK